MMIVGVFWYAGRNSICLTTCSAIKMSTLKLCQNILATSRTYSRGTRRRNERNFEKDRQEFIMLAGFFVVFFFSFFCDLVTHSSSGGVYTKWAFFGWQVAWMHIESRCNVSITQILLVWANNLKRKSKNDNTAPSTKQSGDCIYTHTNPWKKGYCSYFSFSLSLKRAKNILKLIYSVWFVFFLFFWQKTENKALW